MFRTSCKAAFFAAALASTSPIFAASAPVDLDDPAVFAAIREGQPALAARLVRLLNVARFVPPAIFPELVAASFSTATNADASLMFQTSYPARFAVGFEVEGVRYRATVRLVH